MHILEKIIQYKKDELEHFKHRVPLQELKDQVRDLNHPLDFTGALQKPRAPYAIIAEIKKRSPSKGLLRENFDPVAIAQSYEQNGASALSVLTDEHFFGGHLDYLKKVRQRVELPLLRKDFVWDPYQIYAARQAGADAVLLIVAMLELNQMEDLKALASELGMAALVEVHDETETQQAVQIGAAIIGVNNRDLKTFNVELKTSKQLFPLMPEAVLKISESGIHQREHLEELKQSGAHGFLIGEAFMKKENPGQALSQLIMESPTCQSS